MEYPLYRKSRKSTEICHESVHVSEIVGEGRTIYCQHLVLYSRDKKINCKNVSLYKMLHDMIDFPNPPVERREVAQ